MADRKMRAKMQVGAIIPTSNGQEVLHLNCVAKSGGYPADGSDEDNSFARWSPSGHLQLQLANPDLVGTFEVGQKFYVDFTPADA